MRLWNGMIGAALSLLIVGACGGDDSKKDATSSLNSKKVSELNASEFKTLCSWFDTVGDDKITDQESCTQEGADSADSVSECIEYRDECLQEQAIPGSTDDDCTGYKQSLCTVTVSTLKACATALAKAYDDASRNASCDKYEAAQVNDEPAACKGVPDACLEYDVSGVAVAGP